jgi:flagella basal body P-ring formation protein FlgA
VAVTALAVCASAAPAGEAAVRLYPTAVVTDDTVKLADVAELHGESSELAGAWVVAAAPKVGQTCEISLEQVERALAHKGANLSQWIIRGASRCIVSRPKNALSPATQPSPAGAVATCEPVPVDADSLEGIMRAHLERKLADLGGRVLVKFSPAAGKVLALKRPQYEFSITDRADQPLGLVPVEVTVSERGQVVQTLPMLVQVSLSKPVVVAARAINRSQRIEAPDVILAERTIDRLEDLGLGDPGPLIGQQAKRPVGRGELLTARDVEPVPLVNRNDLVTVWVRLGNVTVRGAAKAMTAGTYGQIVTLKNESSNQTFMATVTGPRTAEVPPEPATARADGIQEQVR